MTLMAQEHGTTTSYARGCRCESCRAAQREYARRYKEGVRVGKGRPKLATRHGSVSAYTHYGCRCDECRTGWRDYQRDAKRRERALRRFAPEPKGEPQLQHGRLSTYTWKKCRCDKCKATNARYGRFRRYWKNRYGSERPMPSGSVCDTCGSEFWKKNKGRLDVDQSCSPSCAAKAARARYRRRKTWGERQTSEGWLRLASEQVEVAKAEPGLAGLIAEQERDEKLGNYVWSKSLDAKLADDGDELHEFVASDALDPELLCIQEEESARIRAALGDRTEEELARLDYRTMDWLRGKLQEEGLLSSVSIQASERRRVRRPQSHTGSQVFFAGGHGGKTKRRQKVAAHRHSRPSQKPRKRWTRDSWQFDEEAAA